MGVEKEVEFMENHLRKSNRKVSVLAIRHIKKKKCPFSITLEAAHNEDKFSQLFSEFNGKMALFCSLYEWPGFVCLQMYSIQR